MKPALRLLSPALLLIASCFAQPRSTATSVPDRIEHLVTPQANAGLFSGAILVSRDGKILFERAYGFANWELRAPNTPRRRFGIGSITKPMTEALAAGLVKQGRLKLQAPVETYLPGFPRGPNGGQPTVEQLIKHTAGVPHRVTDAIEETQPLHPADIVERVKRRGLLFEPGTQELYSSAGFTCLARIIEIVEGRPFEDALAAEVFQPARMASATDETGLRLMPDRAYPYILGAGETKPVVYAAPYKDLRFLTGAGSVYATAADMVHFVDAVRNGTFGEDLQNWANAGDRNKWRGWYGRTDGYEASVDVLPAHNLVVVLLSNLRSAANWRLRQAIKDLLDGRPVAPIPFPPPRGPNFESSSTVLGKYGNADDPVTISLHDGQLYRDEVQIYPTAGNVYYIPVSGSLMRFHRSAGGEVDSMITVVDGNERILPKLPSP